MLLSLGFCAKLRANDLKTQSRTPFVHNIPLHDEQDKVITCPAILGEDGKPQDAKGPPFSTAQTCGKCHDYNIISRGWHFNESLGNVKPGRPGEPWILTDPITRTQIPLSYRGWKGTFKPSDLGIRDYDFLTNFARHFPGGGMGEPEKIDDKDPRMGRMQITGKMEIDCPLCHQSTTAINYEDRYNALKGQDFAWTPSITSFLGSFGSFRSAGAIADQWKPGKKLPSTLPSIKYNRARFDPENNVLFQFTRRPPAANCYYCHTTETTTDDARWHSDQDVHLRAGMLCVDCHRNGLDHNIVRGYEGEKGDRTISDDDVDLRAKMLMRDNLQMTDDEARKTARAQMETELNSIDTLSCAGCHSSGRLGSPKPIHKGMPPIHFAKLTCTACHSGPVAGPQPQIVQTSIAHKLGLPMPARGMNTAPIIVEPVFLKDSTGKVAPFKMFWPSYWGQLKNGKVTPLLPAAVMKSAEFPKESSEMTKRDPYSTEPLSDKQIREVLESLPDDPAGGEAVFIAAGKIYRLVKNKLTAEESDLASPYAWAIAHDVRPARQALGARGCVDCHAGNSPEFFGLTVARGPVDPANGVSKAMWELRGEDKTWIEGFSLGFKFRPWLKGIVFTCSFIVAAVLAAFGLRGIAERNSRQ